MSDHAVNARDNLTLEPALMGLDLTTIASICCSLTCCVLFLVVIIGGIVFVLRRGKGGTEEEDEAVGDGPSMATPELDEKPPPAPTMAPQPIDLEPVTPAASLEEDEAPTVIAPPTDSLEAARNAPAAPRKPKAGQTIIAFDDDDDDEF